MTNVAIRISYKDHHDVLHVAEFDDDTPISHPLALLLSIQRDSDIHAMRLTEIECSQEFMQYCISRGFRPAVGAL